MDVVIQLLINGLLLAAVYALLASGLSFLYSATRIFHLAHGAVAVAAGYVFWWAHTKLALGWATAAALAVLAAALLGVLMNELVYEPLRRRGAKGLGYLIATLGLLLLGVGVLQAIFGAAPKTLEIANRSFEIFGAVITKTQIIVLAVTTLLVAAFAAVLKFTKLGLAMRATADNETVARVLGIKTQTVRRQAFALVSVLAAAAGILFILEFPIEPTRAVFLAVFGFAAAVVGGAGSLAGAIIGSLLMGLAEQGAIWFLGAGWRDAFVFALLLVFLLIRPQGLVSGRRQI